MARQTIALNAAVDAVAGLGNWISMHTADPGTTGTAEVTGGSYARQQTTWSTASAGAKTGSQVTVPIPGGTTISWYGIWSAKTGGNLIDTGQLSPQESFGGAGSYNFQPTLSAASA